MLWKQSVVTVNISGEACITCSLIHRVKTQKRFMKLLASQLVCALLSPIYSVQDLNWMPRCSTPAPPTSGCLLQQLHSFLGFFPIFLFSLLVFLIPSKCNTTKCTTVSCLFWPLFGIFSFDMGERHRPKRRWYRPYLPFITMGNVRSLPNKMDEPTALTQYQTDGHFTCPQS